MICSSFRVNDGLQKYPPALRAALDYLQTRDFTQMEPGTYPIQGKEIYALVQEITTCPARERKPESHKRYIDIQYVAQGRERMGFCPNDGRQPILSSREDKDICFYGELQDESFVTVQSGDYCIFFPSDIHRPGCMADRPEKVRKVVVKVSVEVLDGPTGQK